MCFNLRTKMFNDNKNKKSKIYCYFYSHNKSMPRVEDI